MTEPATDAEIEEIRIHAKEARSVLGCNLTLKLLARLDAAEARLAPAHENLLDLRAKLQAERFNLVKARAALLSAREELEQYELDRTGEAYNDQQINAALDATGAPDAT